jgi:TatD DNase family protein
METFMSIQLVDTHSHLDMKDFDPDREQVIARALAAGVTTIITVGTDIDSDRQALALADKHPQVYAAVGLHPHEADRVTEADILQLAELAKHPKVVAIGETGLDFYRNYSTREAQFKIFREQLELAARVRQPIIIHSRQAEPDTVAVLSEWVKRHSLKLPGVIHCFSGSAETAEKYLKLGFFISFAGFVTYPNSRAPQIVKTIPIDRIVVETDCPFLTPQFHRGKRNEPAYVRLTAETLATALEVTPEEFSRQTTENAKRLFKFEIRSTKSETNSKL